MMMKLKLRTMSHQHPYARSGGTAVELTFHRDHTQTDINLALDTRSVCPKSSPDEAMELRTSMLVPHSPLRKLATDLHERDKTCACY